MRHSLRITVLLLGAAVVVLAAGCGGGSKHTVPPIGATGAVGPTSTGGPTGNTGPTGSTGSFASAAHCAQFAGLAAKIASALSGASGKTATAVQTESQELQALADAAPSDIKGDFQTFATAFASYLQALGKAGYKPGQVLNAPSAAQIAALASAAKVFNTPKLTQAEAHLAAWAQANCK